MVIAVGLAVVCRIIPSIVHDCERSTERVILSIAKSASEIGNTRMSQTGTYWRKHLDSHFEGCSIRRRRCKAIDRLRRLGAVSP